MLNPIDVYLSIYKYHRDTTLRALNRTSGLTKYFLHAASLGLADRQTERQTNGIDG